MLCRHIVACLFFSPKKKDWIVLTKNCTSFRFKLLSCFPKVCRYCFWDVNFCAVQIMTLSFYFRRKTHGPSFHRTFENCFELESPIRRNFQWFCLGNSAIGNIGSFFCTLGLHWLNCDSTSTVTRFFIKILVVSLLISYLKLNR